MWGHRGDDDDEREGLTVTAIDEDRVIVGHGAGATRVCCGRGALFSAGRVRG